jgi:hypothetical protein
MRVDPIKAVLLWTDGANLLPSGRDRLRRWPKRVLTFVIDQNLESVAIHAPVGVRTFRHTAS